MKQAKWLLDRELQRLEQLESDIINIKVDNGALLKRIETLEKVIKKIDGQQFGVSMIDSEFITESLKNFYEKSKS